MLGVIGRQYSYDPVHGHVTIHDGANTTVVPIQTGLTFPSSSGYGYVIGYSEATARTPSTARPMFPYAASTTGTPATHALMTAPQMFTLGGNFYTFDRDADRRLRQRHRQSADVSDQPLPVLAQRRRLHHQHQRPAEHGDRRRQRLPDDRRQHAVRAQRRAVHDHAQGRLAERRDDLRPVQHHARATSSSSRTSSTRSTR